MSQASYSQHGSSSSCFTFGLAGNFLPIKQYYKLRSKTPLQRQLHILLRKINYDFNIASQMEFSEGLRQFLLAQRTPLFLGFKKGAKKYIFKNTKVPRRPKKPFLIQLIANNNIMGGIFSSKRKQKSTSQKNIISYVEESFQEVEENQSQSVYHIKRIPQVMVRQKSELTFKDEVSHNKKLAIQKSPVVNNFIHSQTWLIEPELIEHLRLVNALHYVEVSPALVLQVRMVKSSEKLMYSSVVLEEERKMIEEREDQVERQYSVIYADLFRIRYENLKKIKIQGQPKGHSEAIHSLEPVSKIYAPFLQQFQANDHPIRNARFLRKCNWPFLSKLSLRGNAIVDSRQLGDCLTTLTNSCHIESLDIAGQYSPEWSDISWIIKLGFISAQIESHILETNDNYYLNYNNKTLRRIDCSMTKNLLFRGKGNLQLRMISQKFNNTYLENMIAIW